MATARDRREHRLHLILLGAPAPARARRRRSSPSDTAGCTSPPATCSARTSPNGTELGQDGEGVHGPGRARPRRPGDRHAASSASSQPDAAQRASCSTASRATWPRPWRWTRRWRSAGKAIDLALNIAVPDEELVQRLSGRWICRSCGAIYHEISQPAAGAGMCDTLRRRALPARRRQAGDGAQRASRSRSRRPT